MSNRWSGLALGVALLALPAAAHAERITFGSSLAATPNTALSDHSDSGFWHARGTAIPGGGAATVPQGGQILEIRLKGVALVAPNGKTPEAPSPGYNVPNNLIHFQTLKPQPDGNLKVDVTSGAFYMPFNVPEDTISTFKPENLCAAAGDSIDISTIGGWDGTNPGSGGYDAGVPFKIFATVPGAVTTRFHGHGHFNNGATLVGGRQSPPGRPMPVPEPQPSTELLMQVVVGTGPDAFYMCPGGTFNPYRPPDPPRTPKAGKPAAPAVQKGTFPGRQRVNVKKNGTASLALYCQPGPGRCVGTVTIFAKRKKRSEPVAIGSTGFDIGARSTEGHKIKLTRKGHRLFLVRGRKLPVKIVAVTHPGGPDLTDTYDVTLKKVGSR